MDALLNSVLGQIEGSLGTQPADVPGQFLKTKMKGRTCRINRHTAPGCCNVATFERNTLLTKSFLMAVTPLDTAAPMVILHVTRTLRKSRYECEVYEFDGGCYAPRYETIVSDYLDTLPCSAEPWQKSILTYSRHFNGIPGHQGKKQCECFVREFINRTCGIYSDADPVGKPDCDERDLQTELYETVLLRTIE